MATAVAAAPIASAAANPNANANPLAAASAAAAVAADGDANAAQLAAGASGAAVGGAAVAAAEAVPRVLSVQSSVVYGYVGNKSATFPLQVLGFDVDPINTCQFSNHTGYPKFRGAKTAAADVQQCVEGLALNGLLSRYTHVLSGYMAATPLVQALAPVIRQLRAANPKLVFVCDPVLGDNGALYVPADFVPLYRAELLPLADVVTPNQTEAEVLSGIPIASVADALRVCAWFHATYPRLRTVIIKSAKLKPATAAATATADSTADSTAASTADSTAGAKGTGDADTIHCIATTVAAPTDAKAAAASSASPVPTHFYHVRIPVVSGYFSGTGDLCSALLLAWLHALRDDVPGAIERAMNTLQAVLRRTAASGHSDKELLLVQSKRDIEHPPIAHATALRAERHPIPAALLTPTHASATAPATAAAAAK